MFRAFPLDLEVFQWHGDTFDLPERAVRLARSPRYENQAFALCRPLLDRLGSLPTHQARALEGALGIGPPARGDRFDAYAGALNLLAAAAENEPCLACVDDAYLLDDASLEAPM